MELAKNQEHTVTIEGYGEGGMGVARIDGRVVFVHGALRGEKCRVLILKTLKSVAFAKVLEVLEPSSERIESDCPYFPRCGGCTYRHIRYEEELRLKRQRVQDNLSRIGGSDVTVEEILGAQDTLHYRNKAQYPVSKDGAVGFYRARTHEVIECELCLLVKPEAAAAAEALREYMQSCRVAGYDEKIGRGLVRHLYVRSNAAGESLICVLVNGRAAAGGNARRAFARRLPEVPRHRAGHKHEKGQRHPRRPLSHALGRRPARGYALRQALSLERAVVLSGQPRAG